LSIEDAQAPRVRGPSFSGGSSFIQETPGVRQSYSCV
jgi:hypothetical protein